MLLRVFVKVCQDFTKTFAIKEPLPRWCARPNIGPRGSSNPTRGVCRIGNGYVWTCCHSGQTRSDQGTLLRANALVAAAGALWPQVKKWPANAHAKLALKRYARAQCASCSALAGATSHIQLTLEDATRASIIQRSDQMLNTGQRSPAQSAAANAAMTQAKNNPILELFCEKLEDEDKSFVEVAIDLMVSAGTMRDECIFVDDKTPYGSRGKEQDSRTCGAASSQTDSTRWICNCSFRTCSSASHGSTGTSDQAADGVEATPPHISETAKLGKNFTKLASWTKGMLQLLLAYLEPRIFKGHPVDSQKTMQQLLEYSLELAVMDSDKCDRIKTDNKKVAFERMNSLYSCDKNLYNCNTKKIKFAIVIVMFN
eukprot:6402184-Amphidinium_carterae.1